MKKNLRTNKCTVKAQFFLQELLNKAVGKCNVAFIVFALMLSLSITLPKPLSAQRSTTVTNPTQVQELEVMTELSKVLSEIGGIMNDFFFLSFASTIPQAAGITTYGGNSIAFIAPNPYFHMQVNLGLTMIFPLVNFGAVDFSNSLLSEQPDGSLQTVADEIDFLPLNYIKQQGSSLGIGPGSSILHFGLRFGVRSVSPILDKMDFGISYASPHISLEAIDRSIGDYIGFQYRTISEMYGVSLRYRVFENAITSIAVGAGLNYISHSFALEDEVRGVNLDMIRTRRQHVLSSPDIDQLYPVHGPYTLNIDYKLQSSFKATTMEFFMRAEFGIKLFKPFVDIGISILASERISQSTAFNIVMFEDDSIINAAAAGTIDDDTNIIISDRSTETITPSGISSVTPRFSVGFNALKVLNFRFSFTTLRAETFIPSFGAAMMLNFDF